ncbi:uncharacterized protein LOC116947941 [Petromyzon marinus]|uniref:Uncharacterized protein LOC116947941 n=1 Tax=Petromyzon marinus TaxID=7757 RepID=A0AAJ7TLN6_PETMA|nr:uncharacterized protein LOC116947941 [Petromyzon marinus]
MPSSSCDSSSSLLCSSSVFMSVPHLGVCSPPIESWSLLLELSQLLLLALALALLLASQGSTAPRPVEQLLLAWLRAGSDGWRGAWLRALNAQVSPCSSLRFIDLSMQLTSLTLSSALPEDTRLLFWWCVGGCAGELLVSERGREPQRLKLLPFHIEVSMCAQVLEEGLHITWCLGSESNLTIMCDPKESGVLADKAMRLLLESRPSLIVSALAASPSSSSSISSLPSIDKFVRDQVAPQASPARLPQCYTQEELVSPLSSPPLPSSRLQSTPPDCSSQLYPSSRIHPLLAIHADMQGDIQGDTQGARDWSSRETWGLSSEASQTVSEDGSEMHETARVVQRQCGWDSPLGHGSRASTQPWGSSSQSPSQPWRHRSQSPSGRLPHARPRRASLHVEEEEPRRLQKYYLQTPFSSGTPLDYAREVSDCRRSGSSESDGAWRGGDMVKGSHKQCGSNGVVMAKEPKQERLYSSSTHRYGRQSSRAGTRTLARNGTGIGTVTPAQAATGAGAEGGTRHGLVDGVQDSFEDFVARSRHPDVVLHHSTPRLASIVIKRLSMRLKQ